MKTARRKIKLSIVFLLAAAFFAACAATATKTDESKLAAQSNSIVSNANETDEKDAPQNTSSAEAVKVRSDEVNVKIGDSAIVEIEVVIAEGFHVNANPASFDYLQPTELTIEKSEELLVEKPIYPPAESKKFSFSESPIAVYEKIAPIKIRIQARKNTKPGRIVLRGKLRSQPCNDNACFPPRSVEFSLPVQINPR